MKLILMSISPCQTILTTLHITSSVTSMCGPTYLPLLLLPKLTLAFCTTLLHVHTAMTVFEVGSLRGLS